VIVGKKTPTKASFPTIGTHLQQPENQLMLQQVLVLNITVDIVIKIITLKIDDSKKRIKKRRILEEKWHYEFMKLHLLHMQNQMIYYKVLPLLLILELQSRGL
jgi:hypothetical protein